MTHVSFDESRGYWQLSFFFQEEWNMEFLVVFAVILVILFKILK